MEFLTAYAAKDKGADFVVVVGLEAGEYGFPSGVADDLVMRLVLSEGEAFPHAEERRIFYVAMTRARRRVYLIAPTVKASTFVADDLLADALARYVEMVGEVSVLHACPACGGQTIRRRDGQHGAFWACAHFPLCHGKLDACPDRREGGLEPVTDGNRPAGFRCTICGHALERCPKCGEGHLRSKRGPYGDFLSCSRWDGGTGCTYTRDLPATSAPEERSMTGLMPASGAAPVSRRRSRC